MLVENIILENEKLGLITKLYNENSDILGYSEGKTIYLNTFHNSDLETVNKHETLHLYENSKNFKLIKKVIFSLLKKDDISNLRKYYSIKYNGIYKKEDLDNGILDNEIIIDIIIGNGKFPITLENYIKNAYDFIVKKDQNTLLTSKRYLNLVVSTKTKQQFPQLTNWEKIFITNYYNSTNTLPSNKKNKYEKIRETINEELNKLYMLANNLDNFTININSEELIKEYEIEIMKLINKGLYEEVAHFKNNRDDTLKKMALRFTKNLHAEYIHVVNFIKSTDYDSAFKYLMLKETLTKTYKQEMINKEIINIVSKRNLSETIKSHMSFNKTVLDFIYYNVDNYDNFSNLYYDALTKLKKEIYNENVSIDGVDTFNKGKWIRFESKKHNPTSYIEQSLKLSSIVQETPWCTKKEATMHLEEGDFYLFVDTNNKPRLGIKLTGNSIDEVRGIKNGNAQEIEEEYRDVVLEFLNKNKDIKFAEEWIKKEEWTRRLIDYSKKIENNTLSRNDMINLMYDLTEVSDYKPHYEQCNARKELLIKLNNNKEIKKLLAKKYNCRTKDIFVGDINSFNDIKGKKFPYAVVLGNVSLSNCNSEIDFSKLKVILGSFHLENSDFCNFDNLEIILGPASFSHVTTNNFNNLKYIGETADFYESEIKSLKNLIKVGGTLALFYSSINDLNSLETVIEDLHIQHSTINNLYNIKNVHGKIYFNQSLVNGKDHLNKDEISLIVSAQRH